MSRGEEEEEVSLFPNKTRQDPPLSQLPTPKVNMPHIGVDHSIRIDIDRDGVNGTERKSVGSPPP